MEKGKRYMKLCLELAAKGFGKVAPNPMVGSIIVHKGKIIGKGYHKRYGDWHAEVNAINAVKNKKLLPKSTLYVTLEPCNHYGKTPPCTSLIVRSGIPNVVVGSIDPHAIVSGKGMETLRKAGCRVTHGILDKENRELNKRFFTFHEKKRPYIILKWAQTADSFIDRKRNNRQLPATISNPASHKLAHKWRSEEQAIMVGTNTAILDNPRLTVRLIKPQKSKIFGSRNQENQRFSGPGNQKISSESSDFLGGRNPVRIVLDRNLKIPKKFHVFDRSSPTIVFTQEKNKKQRNIDFVRIDFSFNILPQVLDELRRRSIQSLIIEGGAILLESFITQDLWDEARVIVSQKRFKQGVKAPKIARKPYKRAAIKGDKIYFYKNNKMGKRGS